MKKGKLVWLFIDALAWAYLNTHYFPRLTRLMNNHNKSRFRPILGYSHAIIPAILTGLPPGKSNIWSLFTFAARNSPFKWLSRMPLRSQVDRHPVLRYAANRLISRLTGYDTANVPLCLLPELNVSSLTNLFLFRSPPGTVSLIDMARTAGASVSFHGYPVNRTDRETLECLTKRIGLDDVIVCYLTGFDKAGHSCGPDTSEMVSYCRHMDVQLERTVESIERSGYDLVLSSDHGMTSVSEQLDLISALGDLLNGVTYFIDSTIARFYDDSKFRLLRIRSMLDELETGKVYDLNGLHEFGLDFADRRFGDLFFVCRPGCILIPNSFSVLPSHVRGMHGYDPATATEKGIVLSDIELGGQSEIDFGQLHSTIEQYFTNNFGLHTT